jgi:hypothetical protein
VRGSKDTHGLHNTNRSALKSRDLVRYERLPGVPAVAANKATLTEHGFKDASTDPKQITMWWTQYPNANIAIPTGSQSRMLVLDLRLRSHRKRAEPGAVERAGGDWRRQQIVPGAGVEAALPLGCSI